VISVVIPSYNSGLTIRHCLDSVLGQSGPEDREVILVDSSTDGTDRIVTREYPDVRLFHLARKTDPGSARNIGIG
jgi:glycosyltransferase involved in cell wall biosynthesis